MTPVVMYAQDDFERDQHIEAALVFKLLHFVHWPNERLISQSGFNLCINNAGALGQAILDIEPQMWRNVPVQVLPVEAESPNVVYCHAVLTGTVSSLPFFVEQRGLLTIGSRPNFVEHGGVIALVKRGNRFSFDISLHQAGRVGLYLEAPLVQLAYRVVREQ